MFLHGMGRGWGKIIRSGGRYIVKIIQLGETFYQGMSESLRISTYYITIRPSLLLYKISFFYLEKIGREHHKVAVKCQVRNLEGKVGVGTLTPKAIFMIIHCDPNSNPLLK